MYEIFVKLLQEKGIKAAEVSRATGISQTVFSEWKKGKSTPKADKLQKISDFFGVSLAYLMGWEEWNKESERFEEQINNREATLHEVLSAFLDEPKDRETAIEIIKQFSRLSNEGLKKLLERELELVELGYISEIEKESKQQ